MNLSSTAPRRLPVAAGILLCLLHPTFHPLAQPAAKVRQVTGKDVSPPLREVPVRPEEAPRPNEVKPSRGIPVAGAAQGGVVAPAAPQDVRRIAVVSQDRSPRRLGDIVPSTNQGPAVNELIELKQIPLPGSTAGPGPAQPTITDNFIQSAQGPAFSPAPQTFRNMLGIGSGLGNYVPRVAPPDPNGAVGTDHYVQWVNNHFAIFRKSDGQLVYGPAPGNTLWANFPGTCKDTNDGDTIVQFDRMASRWVLTQFSVKGVETNPQGDIIRKLYRQCVAISTTADATGTYDRFEFDYSDFNDYPKVGVWPDGYYVSFNMFQEIPGQPGRFRFIGATVCAYDRRAMLREVNRPVTQQCVAVGRQFGGLLPSDLDGAAQPPAGSPNYFLNFGQNSLNLWRFKVDWDAPANSQLAGPVSIPVAAFQAACQGGACMAQKDVTQPLDSLADRLMYRLSYRHFRRPDGTTDREVLLVNHAIAVPAAGGAARNGIRWYELRNPASATMAEGPPRVHQHGTYAPDSDSRWMGSIAMDRAGNIGMGYSVSGAGLFPSIRFTGRASNDPPGMLRREIEIVPGTGSQEQHSRWGDYSSLNLDPADDCTMWYTAQYRQTTDARNWSTRIFSFRLPNCQ